MFYIPPILRLNPSTVGELVFCLSGFGQSEAKKFFAPEKNNFFAATVTRSRSLPNWHKIFLLLTPYGLRFVAAFRSILPLKTLLKTILMGLRPVFTPSNPLNLFSLWKIPPCRWRGLRPPRGFPHRQAAGGLGGAL